MIIAGFSAYSGILDWKRFREIADKIGAYFLVDMAHVAGLVAAGDGVLVRQECGGQLQAVMVGSGACRDSR